MVMTTGGGLPASGAAQARWLARLIDSRVSSLVIARKPGTPPVSRALLEVAGERAFPVLSARFDLQFVTLARTVIEGAVQAERQRLATLGRLYEVYWQSLRSRGSLGTRISALEGSTGWALEVRDLDADEVVARGEQADRRANGPSRQEAPGEESVQVPLPGTGHVVMVAHPGRQPVQDLALLHHLGGLIALELEHQAAHRDQLRASGQDLLLGLFDDTIALPAVWPELRHRGMTGPVVAACWQAVGDTPLDHENIHHEVRLQSCAPLLAYRPPVLLAIIPDDAGLLTSLAARLGLRCAAGSSAPIAASTQVSEAARQARLAAAQALEAGRPYLRYGAEGPDAGLLPRSLEDTRHLVRRVLGPLVEYDRAHDGSLVSSLRTFLANDGGWQRSAEELGVHRQTLVYRLRKAEQLTGLRPTSTRGSAMLWLALQAADRARLPLDDLVR
jgi:purine catabolism regulator